ncbi:MAG TPA: TIGR01459 family HAD-type hydrolase [Kaistia sp.]|nr:TIGR01459 family HAD-type hydrolase [Kaistia sp.]
MANYSAPGPVPGLASLAQRYDAVLCDVWGVLHNGMVSFPPAREALAAFRAAGGTVVLITNAPRTSPFIIEQIAELGVAASSYDAIVTSGDVTRALLAEKAPARLRHIGPAQHLTLYDGLDLPLSSVEDAEIVCCTGLRDDIHETPEDYEAELAALAARELPMICANPDIVVERGHQLVYCAGALAARYSALGGSTAVAGKPHAPIYEAALERAAAIRGGPAARDRVLAIGDGAPTDLAGAFRHDIDVLFVTGGIHSGHFGPADAPDIAAVHRFLADEGLGATAFLPALTW